MRLPIQDSGQRLTGLTLQAPFYYSHELGNHQIDIGIVVKVNLSLIDDLHIPGITDGPTLAMEF